MQFAEYGEWDNVVHEFRLNDSESVPQPFTPDEDMEDGVSYVESNRLFTVTVDPGTSDTTLTVRHTFDRV